MPVQVVVGAQWGDEAKGKVVDYLARSADIVARYAGGNNAGHTICVGDQVFKFHTVPCGILREHITPVIADGVVLDIRSLIGEMNTLESQGINTTRLRIGKAAHLNLPYHLLMDEMEETRRGAAKLGTTKRGIGPTYADKAARVGLRFGDLLEPSRFRARLQRALDYKNVLLGHVYQAEPLQLDAILDEYLLYGERLKPLAVHAPNLLSEARQAGKAILMEGAQGTLLDLDYGTYPYVTSSHPIAAGACLGTGLGPRHLDEIWGVAKAYSTRVGEGPFPSELTDERGDYIRERGKEYGTTTGRARRCGWLDLVALRYSAQVNSFTALAITLLDVLSGLDELFVCVAYRCHGEQVSVFDPDAFVLSECEAVYERLPGWKEEIDHCRRREDLPVNAQNYLQFIESFVDAPIRLISLGPEREQTIFS